MLKGVATLSFFAVDHRAAIGWYSELLGVEPYFHRPGYAEFRIGDYQTELGIIDAHYMPGQLTPDPAGVIVFWQVDDVDSAFRRLIALGATEHEAVRDRGAGFRTASVVDPFGNILGVMHNPHYLEVLAAS
jgi:predicted enzyme related to lactoylglutathione lyase